MTQDKARTLDAGSDMPTLRDALIGAIIGALIIYGGTFVPVRWLRWLIVGIGVVWVLVMLGYALAVTGESLRDKLAPRVRKLRGHVRTDPVLGTLHRDVRARCWISTPSAARPEVEVDIDGDVEPDPQLVARAREAVSGFETLRARVNLFLRTEADLDSADPELASQIRDLRIVRLVFVMADHPHTFQIEFKGPDEDIYWRCDYSEGGPRDLDFDS